MSSLTLGLQGGRQLGYATVGEGSPVMYFHGTASSRLEIFLLKQFAQQYHFKLVGVDRPGYGLSTFTPRRNFHDFAEDVNRIADCLHVDQFALLSWSGGGPFALTYLAHFSERVSRAVIVCSPALPFNVAFAHGNNPLAQFAMKNQHIALWALKSFKRTVLKAQLNIEAYLASKDGEKMLAAWSEPDLKFFANPSWLKLMYASTAEAFRQGNSSLKTIFQEHKLFMNPWSEPIGSIPPNKLVLWQGMQDKTVLPVNAYRLAQAIPAAQLELFPGEGHCVMFAETEKLSKALKP
ncbi:MAG: alpha/beta hydrolase [Candidatus Bathyarchaeota archaeon]|nr:alpha/beta hydrolase [Candidatus Bathyarchaeota archaeon]